MCDQARFCNMVGQLLDNAAKFTHDGEIRLVAAREASPRGDELLIHVVDTGIGIAADKIAGLFEKFTAAEDFSTSKYGGTGLGLALSQRLCKLMGGDILVESELGKGSRFTIRMPLLPTVGRENPDTAMTTADLAATSIVPALDAAESGPASETVAVTA
jgi:signal transduction histidine kinase